jgi:selenide,water dikinase
MGITSSLQTQNLRASSYISNMSEAINNPKYPLLFDPQTSGGLLASVPAENANHCLNALDNSDYQDSRIIGQTLEVRSSALALFLT